MRAEFFEPCLRNCSRYDRAAGYFRSSALKSWCGILPRLISGAAESIRLLISPDLSPADREALVRATDPIERDLLRQELSDSILTDLIPKDGRELTAERQVELLAWMIANEKLEIRFAFPDHVSDPGIYHEKIGLFSFPWGETIAFTGSANETLSGHERNWESVDVFRSWDPSDQSRVAAKSSQFEDAWHGHAPGLKILRLSASVLEQIRRISPQQCPVLSREHDGDGEDWLFDHQREALNAWREHGKTGLLEMCTGSGKTRTAIQAAAWLSKQVSANSGTGTLLIIACPTKVLVEQWDEEIQKWQPDWLRLKAYDSTPSWASNLNVWLGHGGERTYAIITTYDTLFSGGFISQLRRAPLSNGHSVFIADEAHHLGTRSKLETAEEILPLFEARLALTATPEIEGSPDRTRRLESLFGGNIYQFSLDQAIEKEILCPYHYFPRPAFLDATASIEYVRLISEIDSSDGQRQIDLYRRKRELLGRSGVYVAEFERLLDELEASGESIEHTVVYSPRGRDEDDERILTKVKSALSERNLLVATITADTPQSQRTSLLTGFRERKFQVLLGIGCLDEGLDVPETRRAIVLYSFDRMKQFIQRRGRVLRKAEGKEYAEIHDLILLPQASALPENRQQQIIERELRRYREFAANSLNPTQAREALDRALDTTG